MSDQICTIVGMGPGVSFSVAKEFGKKGFTIAMISRNAEKLERYKSQLQDLGYHAHAFPADAADFEQLKGALEKIQNTLGNTEVLVYNTSVYREANPTQLEPELAVDDFRANVAGALVAVQSVVPKMKEKKQGTILITGGGQALEPFELLSSLAIGKSAIRSLAFSLHKELAPFNIRVVTITINGQVDPNTKFSPELISKAFIEAYEQNGEPVREIIFQ